MLAPISSSSRIILGFLEDMVYSPESIPSKVAAVLFFLIGKMGLRWRYRRDVEVEGLSDN